MPLLPQSGSVWDNVEFAEAIDEVLRWCETHKDAVAVLFLKQGMDAAFLLQDGVLH